MRSPLAIISVPFILSGAAALTYQVCWQRLLYVALGSDIQSVTIIISTFMLGLGAGAAIGGAVADRYPNDAIKMFALAEAVIGVFGLLSPTLIRELGSVVIRAPLPVIAAANFFLLLIPTTLMGGTLPLLVAHLVRHRPNVGIAVGTLYALNTLGAAVGALLVGFFWFYYFGIDAVVFGAALTNLAIAALVLLTERRAA